MCYSRTNADRRWAVSGNRMANLCLFDWGINQQAKESYSGERLLAISWLAPLGSCWWCQNELSCLPKYQHSDMTQVNNTDIQTQSDIYAWEYFSSSVAKLALFKMEWPKRSSHLNTIVDLWRIVKRLSLKLLPLKK